MPQDSIILTSVQSSHNEFPRQFYQ